MVGEAFIKVWAHDLKFDLNNHQLQNLFILSLDNFFLFSHSLKSHYFKFRLK